MSSEKPITFISCGQFTESERQLGRRITEIVDASGVFRAYFAENQSSFQGVTRNIFAQLYNCFGLICVMHDRGTVSSPHGESTTRASVWVEQEIAIAAFLAEVLNRDVKTRVYVKRGINREGVRDKVIINPKEFEVDEEILTDLPAIIREWAQLFALEKERFTDLLERLGIQFRYNREILSLDLSNFTPVFYDQLLEIVKSGEIERFEAETKASLKRVYLDLTNYDSHLRRIESIPNYSNRMSEVGIFLSPAKAAARESVDAAIQLIEQQLSNASENPSGANED